MGGNIKLTKKDEIRLAAEADLETFIRLVHPQRVLGAIHSELIRWWTRSDAKSHQLVLLPRDHGKSAMVAYRVAWEITRNPCIRILYISSTANLAVKQLGFIKQILTSDIYRTYWPEMVNKDEAKREKWTESEISVDHPLRKAEAIRDPTIFTAGLTTTITGMHSDINVLDDVVVNENAYSVEGREKVATQYSFLSSIGGTEGREWTVGTRYHPKDLYNDMISKQVDVYKDNELVGEEPLYEKFERQVESLGDGTGEFLWPVQTRYDGRKFGFDANILAKKRAQYFDRTQFRAQYYNDPNDPDATGIKSFQYYDRALLRRTDGRWFLKSERLNLFAGIDFAYSLRKEADFSTIVVIGMDGKRNIYVLDIDRFKTVDVSEYFRRILALHKKWDFRRLRAEVNAAQIAIVNELKMSYIRPYGLSLSIDEKRSIRNKVEWMNTVLQPKYAEGQIWHYQGGNCQILEEELIRQHPPHDDIKDCLAGVVEIAIPPTSMNLGFDFRSASQDMVHNRFGGIA